MKLFVAKPCASKTILAGFAVVTVHAVIAVITVLVINALVTKLAFKNKIAINAVSGVINPVPVHAVLVVLAAYQ